MTVTPEYTFRDAALRSLPLRLLNLAGGTLARFGAELPSIDAESIVKAAQRSAGSEDTSGDSFREPLERYLSAVREEAQLNTFGRVALRGMLVSALSNRIKLAAWAREHPEVREEHIGQPWVIVGLPRTGTSLLSILLGLDPLSRPLLHWEAADPIPPPTLATAGEDARIAANAKEWSRLLALNPAIGAMHPFGATVSQECVALFMYDVRTLGVETQALVPSYGRWLQDCNMSPAFEQHRLALQTLQSARPTERWVLKTPNHLWCLDTLLSFYPDARVLWTHRDPGKVVASLASLVNALQSMFTSRRDPLAAANEWRGKVRHAIASGMAFDAQASGDWCAHVRYAEFIADPIGTVRSLYALYGEEVSALHERRMAAWMRDRSQEALGRHVYDPKDFGWSYDELAEEFRGYTQRYDVARE